MKNALILHGTNGNSEMNWFPWLKEKLERNAYKVWVPNLPDCDQPNVHTYNKFLLNSDWNFNDESIIIGHSSGAVEILSLLQLLPQNLKIKSCYLIGSFKNNLGRDDLKDLFIEEFDFDLIRSKADNFILFHSNNDPYCPLEHAEYLSEKLNGKLIIIPGQAHFSIGTAGEKYKKFPELLEEIIK